MQFGEFIFDPDQRRLWHRRRERHLSGKAFELLKLLIERRPAVVSKADIFERLWPGTFVSDTNVPTLIAEIRQALDERADRPRFIRTVHGFGFESSFGAFPLGRTGTIRGRDDHAAASLSTNLGIGEIDKHDIGCCGAHGLFEQRLVLDNRYGVVDLSEQLGARIVADDRFWPELSTRVHHKEPGVRDA